MQINFGAASVIPNPRIVHPERFREAFQNIVTPNNTTVLVNDKAAVVVTGEDHVRHVMRMLQARSKADPLTTDYINQQLRVFLAGIAGGLDGSSSAAFDAISDEPLQRLYQNGKLGDD